MELRQCREALQRSDTAVDQTEGLELHELGQQLFAVFVRKEHALGVVSIGLVSNLSWSVERDGERGIQSDGEEFFLTGALSPLPPPTSSLLNVMMQ